MVNILIVYIDIWCIGYGWKMKKAFMMSSNLPVFQTAVLLIKYSKQQVFRTTVHQMTSKQQVFRTGVHQMTLKQQVFLLEFIRWLKNNKSFYRSSSDDFKVHHSCRMSYIQNSRYCGYSQTWLKLLTKTRQLWSFRTSDPLMQNKQK